MNEDIARVLQGEREWCVVQGDCLEILPTLPEGCFDCILTDPPYSSGGAFRGDRMRSTDMKYVCDHEVQKFHPLFTGDNRDQRSYGYWCALWLSQCLRVAKPGVACCLFSDWRQLPTTSDALQSGGWVWRGIVVWDKTEGARPNMGQFKAQCEYIAWGSKGPIPQSEVIGCLNGLFRVAPFRGKLHIAGKPIELMSELVRICLPHGIVLDPFAGSATTGVACLKTDRRFIGIELDGHYCDVARRRLEAAEADQRDSLFPAREDGPQQRTFADILDTPENPS